MKLLTFVFAAALVSAQGAFASVIPYTANLTGGAEVPGNNSPGTGFADVIVNTVANTMQVVVTFTGLTGTTTGSHIHCCTTTPDVGNSGVATTVPSFAGFPAGVTSGTYNQTLDLTLASSYNPAFVSANGGNTAGAETALLAGMAADDSYLNIHTTAFPGGEIRGYLLASPEPATVLLTASALVGLAALRRKR